MMGIRGKAWSLRSAILPLCTAIFMACRGMAWGMILAAALLVFRGSVAPNGGMGSQ